MNRRDYQQKKGKEKYDGVRDIGNIPDVVNPLRRKKCAKNLPLFLKTYMPVSFYRPWSNDHKKQLAKIKRCVLEGGLFAMAASRGDGKTTRIEGSTLWAALYGYQDFIVTIGAKAIAGEEILNSIKMELETNDKLAEDFPEAVYPFQKLDGISLRCKGQTYNGGIKTFIEYKNNKIVFPTIEGSKSSGVIIVSRGITGSIRGLRHKTPDGVVVRPSLALLDDVQTTESADSPSQCDKREKLINSDVLGLAGLKNKIAGFMLCTIIKKNDLSDRFLDHVKNPDWQGEIAKLVYKFPDAQETLWEEYKIIRSEGILAGDNGAAATEFYRQNRKAMDKGALLGWKHRKYSIELSALQHAENLLCERGKSAFYAEFQNDPIADLISLYELSTDIVASRLNFYPRLQIPPECNFLVAGIDINVGDRGINYVVNGVCNDLTSYTIDYGRHPESGAVWKSDGKTGLSEAQALYTAILFVCDLLINQKQYMKNGERKVFDGILIDCGYMTETVFKACKHCNATMPAPIMPSRGRSGKHYRPSNVIGIPGENFHKTEWRKKGNVIVHNSDIWKMHTQKAFLLKPQAPGSISLYGKDATVHRRYSESICAEVLSEFVRGDLNDHYTWSYRPGYENDLLDAQIIAIIAAGVCGASATGGESSWRSKQKPVKKKTKGRATYG